MADMIEWMVVYEDPATTESTHENIWAESMEEARTEFLELSPDVTRVIGIYVAETVGCTKKYSGEAPKPDPTPDPDPTDGEGTGTDPDGSEGTGGTGEDSGGSSA
ncbi:hypothetical protein LIS04_34 [Listeria phage LIS04]|nr:hypothetical protein LIS04_34 [Listeria phage LIS04]